jgi:hypothetical protein
MLLGEAVTAGAGAAAARTGTARAQRAVRSAVAVAVLASWASRCAEGAPAHDMALFAAAMKNNPDKIDAALRAGANVDAVNLDMEKNTALVSALLNGPATSFATCGCAVVGLLEQHITTINATMIIHLRADHGVGPWARQLRGCSSEGWRGHRAHGRQRN